LRFYFATVASCLLPLVLGARHHVLLEATFCHQKAASKPLKDAFYASLFSEIKQLSRSDQAQAAMILEFGDSYVSEPMLSRQSDAPTTALRPLC
jgi:hypothetical protein